MKENVPNKHLGLFSGIVPSQKPCGQLLRMPFMVKGGLRKGVLICSYPDLLVSRVADIKKWFWIVERRGWCGASNSKEADILLVDDIPAQISSSVSGQYMNFGNAEFVNTDLFRPDDSPKVYDAIMIANWHPYKRHHLVIEALKFLQTTGRGIRLALFGHFPFGGTSEEIAYKQSIVETIRRENLSVEIPNEEAIDNQSLSRDPKSIAQWIRSARVGMLTSKYEGINRFKMECIACNVPIVVCKDSVWPIRKHVSKETGLLVPANPKAIAKGILHLIDHPPKSPRNYLLTHSGMKSAMKALQAMIDQLDKNYCGIEETGPLEPYNGRNESLLWGSFIPILLSHLEKFKKCYAF